MNIFTIFDATKTVLNPKAWKKGQVRVNQVISVLAAVLLAAKGLGYDLHMDDATVAAIGTGLFSLLNWVFTVVTTDKIDILGRTTPNSPVAGPSGDGASSGQPQTPAPVGSVTTDPSSTDQVRGRSPDNYG